MTLSLQVHSKLLSSSRMKEKERRVRVMLEVTDSNPRAIASIGIRLLPSRPSSKLAPGKIKRERDCLWAGRLSQQGGGGRPVLGAALVAKNGQPILERAYGLADRPAHRPNRLDTRFNLGSMNKMFTGVAIMQLVEQGKLSLQDTIDKCLPDYPDKEIARQVTVHQLLTHTSGLGDFFNEKFRTASHRPEKLADLSLISRDNRSAFLQARSFGTATRATLSSGSLSRRSRAQTTTTMSNNTSMNRPGWSTRPTVIRPRRRRPSQSVTPMPKRSAQEAPIRTARSEPSKCQFQARRSRAARAGQLGRRRILNGA